jgi:hypothetical protein
MDGVVRVRKESAVLTMSLVVLRMMLAGSLAFVAMQPEVPADRPEPPAVQPERPALTDGQPVAAPTADAQPAETPSDITTADDLLRALETAGEDIRRLSATVRYVKTFAIQGDTQVREGRLVFASEPGVDGQAPARRFGITFDTLKLGERVEDIDSEYLEQYIFDGEWLAEVRPLDKEFVRRQVVPAGERWDPLRLGEGPFPIPIQQRREDILARFDAELLDGPEGVDERSILGIAGKCYQLRLTPRADAGENELREIRVWYQMDTLLPRLARTLNAADDVSFVALKDLRVNDEAEFDEAELSTEPPTDLTGWDTTTVPFRE